MLLKLLACTAVLIASLRSEIIYSGDRQSKLRTRYLQGDGILLDLIVGNETKLSGHIGRNITLQPITCHGSTCSFIASRNFTLTIKIFSDSFNIQWVSLQNSTLNKMVFKDCFNLNSTLVSWYGGPEVRVTEWPINKLKFNNRPYISSKWNNGAVMEAYWLNSKGGLIWVNSTVPLFVDQNNEEKDAVCFKGQVKAPFRKHANFLAYNITAKNNSRDAHLLAINRYIGKPHSLPDHRMVKEPIWTTWGKYKAKINDSTVRAFMRDIHKHNFTKGQIEIDDKWEACYGELRFDTQSRFSGISDTVNIIHSYGFRATVWTHPFVNTECTATAKEGIRRGIFVNSSTGNAVTSWWNGNSSYVIDFTNQAGSNWFKDKLISIHNNNRIDGFKCDAGENGWLPYNPIFNTSLYDEPNSFTRRYIETCSELGGFVEVRSGFRTQWLKVFVRMMDKDSVWGNNNGLKALVHSLLQFNMIGYTFVLPDLVGGNGYNGQIPTPELLVRWTQANAFMPSIQFSYLPWDMKEASFNTTEIVRNFTNLRAEYSDMILEAMLNCTVKGTPVNPPIWWIDPTDPVALKVDDEFLLGEKILVAPVLEEGARSRDVYLPKGKWKDGNNGTIYTGGKTLRKYKAPISILPYFIRII